MPRRGLAVLCLVHQAALAGCLCFTDPPLESACVRSSSELVWFNAGRLLERVKLPRLACDRELYDAALGQGLAVKGDLRFELRASGPHLVEVFLVSPPDDQSSFMLEADGRTIDSRYRAYPQPARPRPPARMRAITLLGVFTGAFTVRSDSPRYMIAVVRWTPVKEFEDRLAPGWLDRARQMVADPFFEDLRAARRDSLEQLYDRLALSSRPEIRREAVIGQARAAYWLAVKDQEPRDISRLDTIFREAFPIAKEDRILREMISSSCAERNVRKGRMPYSSYCIDAAPVPWSVSLTPDPPGAPEWATSQRRLAARLEAITRWWVERRQRANGELGGGWEDDTAMLQQWGPLALGLGSPAAATGLRRLAEGLRESGQPGIGASGPAHWYTYLTGGAPGDAVFEDPGESLPLAVLWDMAFAARDSEPVLSRDFDMYTSEVIYTGRVYYPVTPEYWQHLLGGTAPRGDRLPAFAVTWPASEASFARAVLASTATSLKFRVYSFEARSSTAEVRLWRLDPGRYRWTAADPVGAELASGDLMVSRRPQILSFPLPPGREVDITIRTAWP